LGRIRLCHILYFFSISAAPQASIQHLLNLRSPFREADWRGLCMNERSEMHKP
jgi:hypothetical protein